MGEEKNIIDLLEAEIDGTKPSGVYCKHRGHDWMLKYLGDYDPYGYNRIHHLESGKATKECRNCGKAMQLIWVDKEPK